MAIDVVERGSTLSAEKDSESDQCCRPATQIQSSLMLERHLENIHMALVAGPRDGESYEALSEEAESIRNILRWRLALWGKK